MTTTKLWRNGWIIGEKDKNYGKFKQKCYNNLPLNIQHPGGLASYQGMKRIDGIDRKIHHFVDNLSNFHREISIFRPKKHAKPKL